MIILEDRLKYLEILTLKFYVELLLSVSENLQQNVFLQEVSTYLVRIFPLC